MFFNTLGTPNYAKFRVVGSQIQPGSRLDAILCESKDPAAVVAGGSRGSITICPGAVGYSTLFVTIDLQVSYENKALNDSSVAIEATIKMMVDL